MNLFAGLWQPLLVLSKWAYMIQRATSMGGELDLTNVQNPPGPPCRN